MSGMTLATNGSGPAVPRGGVVQVTGELVATRRAGAYQHVTFAAPGIAELAAAVQGIEARRSGELRVKSLQDHARDLDLFGTGAGR